MSRTERMSLKLKSFKKFPTIILILLISFSNGCSKKQLKLGDIDNPIKIFFTPSIDAETITSNSKKFIQYLEKETGLFFKSGIPTSYIAVVEALGSERADVAVLNSFGYILAHKKYGAEAKLTVIRYGEDFYRGQIIAHVDHNIKDVKDLNGLNFAFTDPSSSAGYLFPSKLLKDNNVNLKNITFANKHDNVVTMVYQKTVHAGATYYSPPSESGEIRDARAKVKTFFPDVEEKVKIIALTEPIKNDPFVFRKGFPTELTEKIVLAIEKYLSTPEGKQSFREIYSVENVIRAKDSDYDGLRKMLEVMELESEDLLKKK